MAKMNPVVHFEMPAEDRERMANFYAKVFGWQTQIMGEDFGNYVVVTTTESDDNGPKKPGAINGGFYDKSPESRDRCPSVVIAVDDINEAMEKIKDAGGKLLKGGRGTEEPDDIPGVGLYISFIDTEGNRVSVLQPAPRMGQRQEK